MRSFTRAYAHLTHTLAAEKTYLLSLLYLWASDYQRREEKPFSNLFATISQYILNEFADIQAIAAIPLAELTALLVQRSGNTFPNLQANADKLHQVTQHSDPIPNTLADTLHRFIQHTLAHIRFLPVKQTAVRQLIEQELTTLPEAKQALDFKGLGPILMAGCLSEIQNTTRFVTGSKFDRRLKQRRPRTYRDRQASVAKLVGLWWPRRDSGRVQDLQPHLARERNPYLRYWLVQAAHTLQRYQSDYHRFYWKKYRQAHPIIINGPLS